MREKYVVLAHYDKRARPVEYHVYGYNPRQVKKTFKSAFPGLDVYEVRREDWEPEWYDYT